MDTTKLMTNEEICQAYKCNFTDEEIQDIKAEFKTVNMDYCDHCECEVDDRHIEYDEYGYKFHSSCGNQFGPVTFKQWVMLDSKSLSHEN